MNCLLTAVVMVASPSPNPPGAGDSSPGDWHGAWWVVVAVAVVVLIVGAGTLYLQRTRRIDMTQFTDREDEERHHQSR